MITNLSIIVVDDEENLRTLIATVLSHAGYTVECAEDGSEAISMLRRKPFNIAILDIKMPNVDGIEVLKFIQTNCPAMKSIMLTGYADLSNAMECLRYGAKDFISKPFSIEDLLSTVKRVLQE